MARVSAVMTDPLSILYELAFWIDQTRVRNSRRGDFYRFVVYRGRVPYDVDLLCDATHVLMKPRHNPDKKPKKLKILCFLLTAYLYYLKFHWSSKTVFGRPLPGVPALPYSEAFVSAALPAIPYRIYLIVNGKQVDRAQARILVRCPFCLGLHEHRDRVGWHMSLCTHAQHVPDVLENYNAKYWIRRSNLKFREHEYVVTHFFLDQIFRALGVSNVLNKKAIPYEIGGIIENFLYLRHVRTWTQ